MSITVVTPSMIYSRDQRPYQFPTPAGLCSDVPALLTLPASVGYPYHSKEATLVIPEDPTHGGNRHAVRTVIEGAGWRTSPTDGAWFTCFRGNEVVHLGVFEWMDGDPLVNAARILPDVPPTPWGLLNTLWQWRSATHSHYRHTPGVAAIASIRNSGKWNTYGPQEHRIEPRWVLQDSRTVDYWRPPVQLADLRVGAVPTAKKTRYAVHRWDTRAAYLAAAAAVELPYRQLAEDATPVAGEIGYFRVQTMGTDGDHLLLPAKADRQGTRWLGSSTLTLWGRRTNLEIVEAHASGTHRTGRILRHWAENWRDAMARHADLRSVLKMGYAQALGGLLGVASGTIYRPDWRHLIMDELRAQVTRRILRVWDEHKEWPVKVDVDAVYYDTEYPAAVGETLGVGDRIGNMRYEGEVTS